MSTTKKAWINGLFLAITLAVNTIGALGLINGLSQKQISDMYHAKPHYLQHLERYLLAADNFCGHDDNKKS